MRYSFHGEIDGVLRYLVFTGPEGALCISLHQDEDDFEAHAITFHKPQPSGKEDEPCGILGVPCMVVDLDMQMCMVMLNSLGREGLPGLVYNTTRIYAMLTGEMPSEDEVGFEPTRFGDWMKRL